MMICGTKDTLIFSNSVRFIEMLKEWSQEFRLYYYLDGLQSVHSYHRVVFISYHWVRVL